MSLTRGSQEFLQAVFGADFPRYALLSVGLLGPHPLTMRAYNAGNIKDDDDVYWCVAAFPADDSCARTLARALEVRALVLDDVGTKVDAAKIEAVLGTPTAIIETSAGNFQWVWRLEPALSVEAFNALRAWVERETGASDGKDAVHVFRLPQGINSKPGRGRFAVKSTQLNSGVKLSVGNHPLLSHAASSGPGPSGPQPARPLQRRVFDIRRLVALIPNTADYGEWIAMGERIKALALDEEEGRRAFHEWSARTTVNRYDVGVTDDKWETFTPTGTRGQLVLDMAQGADPAGYDGWWQGEAARAFDDGVSAPPVPPGRGSVQFELGSKKEILRSRVNAEHGLLGLDIKCTYDAFHHRMYIERAGRGRETVTDHAVMRLRVELTNVYGRDFGTVVMWDAVVALALGNEFNPVCEMLDAAEALWDGVKRLDRLGPDYFNTEDTELARACFRKVMVAAVRRARRPGCKFDQILVTESPEGWNKSSAWEALAGKENFSDADILGKDARAVQEELADVWIHEIADLSGLTKSEVEHVKAFASRTNDRARPAYGRVLIDQPRQSIEVGTTNAAAYLLSPTGNRRFWPFTLTQPIKLDLLRKDRLQLWGEAASAESVGETLVLAEKLWPVAGEAQEKRRVIDTWEIELENLPPNLIEERNGWLQITGLAVQEHLGGYRRQTLNSGSGRKIAEIMIRLGWERTVFKVDGKPVRGYKRAKVTICNPSVTPSVTENPF